VLRESNKFSSRHMLKVFPDAGRKGIGLDKLLRKTFFNQIHPTVSVTQIGMLNSLFFQNSNFVCKIRI